MIAASLAGHLEVDLTLLPTERSGRRAPLVTGLRTTFESVNGEWDAFVVLEQLEFLFPAEQCRAYLQFRTPQASVRGLARGQVFRLRDGACVIATGTVRNVVDANFSEPQAGFNA